MKTAFPLLFLTLAISTVTHGSIYSPVDDDIEKVVSATLFAKVDTDKNNKVSLEEIYIFRTQEDRKRKEARADEMIAKCDKNKDGKVGGDELESFSMDDFDPSVHTDPNDCRVPSDILIMMDQDGDGFVTKKEVIDASMQRRRPPKRMQDKLDKKQAERMKKHQQEQFGRCDKDKDEFLTLREAASMHCNMYTEMFDTRDENGDSLISPEEMQADVKPPKFEPSFGRPDIEHNIPPSISLEMKLSTCDKNENDQLELTETASKECAVDLNFFNSVDHNSDGSIDFSETQRMHMKKTFDELDTNKDGWLDKKEFKGSRVRYM